MRPPERRQASCGLAVAQNPTLILSTNPSCFLFCQKETGQKPVELLNQEKVERHCSIEVTFLTESKRSIYVEA